MRWITELGDWWAELPGEWALLVLLPFFVAAVALVADGAHRRDARKAETRRAAREGLPRHARPRA